MVVLHFTATSNTNNNNGPHGGRRGLRTYLTAGHRTVAAVPSQVFLHVVWMFFLCVCVLSRFLFKVLIKYTGLNSETALGVAVCGCGCLWLSLSVDVVVCRQVSVCVPFTCRRRVHRILQLQKQADGQSVA